MSEEGFIMLGRSFFSHPLWAEEREYTRAEAWLDLIATAAFKTSKRLVAGVMIEVQRGGIVASERFLSGRWKWSRTKVRAFLDLLKAEKMVTLDHEKTTGCTIVLLCNYDRFNTPEKPPKDQTETTEVPPKDQREEGKEGEIEQRERAAGRKFPAEAEVIAHGKTLVPPATEIFCSSWWNEMSGAGWVDRQKRPIHPARWKFAFAGSHGGSLHVSQEITARNNLRVNGLSASRATPTAPMSHEPPGGKALWEEFLRQSGIPIEEFRYAQDYQKDDFRAWKKKQPVTPA